MSQLEMYELAWAMNNDKAKAVRILKERGYSDKAVSQCTGISEERIKFMVRRE